jgi:ApbE superfamily uncharacterized protein (UPF0280 family)
MDTGTEGQDLISISADTPGVFASVVALAVIAAVATKLCNLVGKNKFELLKINLI